MEISIPADDLEVNKDFTVNTVIATDSPNATDQ